MNKATKNYGVGIIVPTMNRPDFMIRQLNYYANLNYPDTIYIGDSSQRENAIKLRNEIQRLRDKLKVDYQPYPAGDGVKCIIHLLTCVREKYVTFIGDDDYQVPNTLYACAEFLENNKDYETAMGQSVTIRVENDKTYGKLTEIHDYPRYSIKSNSASERLLDYLVKYSASIVAAVLPAQHMLKYFQNSYIIKDLGIKGELLPCSLMMIAGKSKILDGIGLVRQIHAENLKLFDIFDQITSPDWPESYALIKKILTDALIEKENICPEIAVEIVKKCFWANINNQLTTFYPQYLGLISPPLKKKTKIRTEIAKQLPFLKKLYRMVRPLLTDKQQLHYEVLQPNSKYYKDFQPIVKSLSK